MNRRNTKKPPRASPLRMVIESLENRAMLAGVGPESWSAPGLAPAPLGNGSLFSSGIILTCSSPTPGSSGTASPPAPAAGSGGSQSTGLALPSNSGSGTGSSSTGSGSSSSGGLALPSNSGSGAGSSHSGTGSTSDPNSPVLSSQYTGSSNAGGQGNGTNSSGTLSGSDLWLMYGVGLGAAISSSGASGGSLSNRLPLLAQYTEGSSARGQGNGTGGTLSNADLWRLYWSGAGAGSSPGSDNGSLADDPTISAQYTSGSGIGRITPLVYDPESDGPPVFHSGVWTGDEGEVQFVQTAEQKREGTPQPEFSGPTIQAAPPWYVSAWYTFFGRLASDQPLISDPRGSKSFETGGRTYTVPNYVHDDTFYWIAGNLYHRPLVGDVIGAVEAPFRLLANPGRYASAVGDGVVNTITNVPNLPEILDKMPDYQRQDMAIRLLAIPYLKAVGPAFGGAGKTAKTQGPIADSADDAAAKAGRVVRNGDDAVGALEDSGLGKIAPKSGLGNATRLSADELATGARLEAQLGKSLKESTHLGADYVDDLGRSYDALGGFDPKFFNEKRFLLQIDKHLRKSNDFTVIDLTGFSQAQIDAVRRHLSTLSPEQIKSIIQIGF